MLENQRAVNAAEDPLRNLKHSSPPFRTPLRNIPVAASLNVTPVSHLPSRCLYFTDCQQYAVGYFQLVTEPWRPKEAAGGDQNSSASQPGSMWRTHQEHALPQSLPQRVYEVQ